MRPSAHCYDIVKGIEKFRPTAYLPTPKDVPTIGYGHTRGVKMGDTCTLQDGEDWLAADMAHAAASVTHAVSMPLTQNQFDALVSLVFNIGGPQFLASTMLRKLNDRDYAGAAAQFPRWNKQAGKVLKGLTTRRAIERALFEKE